MKAVLLLSVLAIAFATSIAVEICSLTHDTGKCRGYFERYYYNQENNLCQEFIYGGCQGNANNFESEEECLNACGIAVEICSLTHDTGKCRGYFERYYYNQENNLCQEFIYGGCQGNANNFESEEECLNACETY